MPDFDLWKSLAQVFGQELHPVFFGDGMVDYDYRQIQVNGEGSISPIGKTIIFWGEHSLEVRGVICDVPDNSHIKFTVLVSAETLHQISENASRTAWGWYDFNT